MAQSSFSQIQCICSYVFSLLLFHTSFQNFNAQFGALIVTLINSMFSTATPSLLAFPEERPVFLVSCTFFCSMYAEGDFLHL